MTVDIGTGLLAVGAGLAVGLSAVGAGMGEGPIGAAAVGALAEKEELFGKGILMTVLPESLIIFGLVIALKILGMAG